MAIIAQKIRVKGRVQGVWFRASTKKKADELGLTGSVRNMPDGSVYIEVKGPAENVATFKEWCHHGPELARVDEVMVENIDIPNTQEFIIIRE